MKPAEPTPKRKASTKTLLFMLLALLLLFFLQWKLGHYKQEALELRLRADSLMADSLRKQDSIQKALTTDSSASAESLRIADSIIRAKFQADSLDSIFQRKNDSLRIRQGKSKGYWDSIQQERKLLMADSIRKTDSIRHADSLFKHQQKLLQADSIARKSDTLPPQGQLLPPAGRYYKAISLRMQCLEPRCVTRIALGDTSQPSLWTAPIAWNKTGLVWWQLEDSLGNRTPWTIANYDMAADNRCPTNTYPVPVGAKLVCVDAYEYPNEPESKPRDMVNRDEAEQLCQKAGKHLCSLEEWQAACKGKDKLRYPYGNRYDQTRCATTQTQAERSGRKEGCRSWWGMSDMSGNLWEWTSTPHKDRPSFYLVAGGSWNTEDASSCSETKFSFYPQNQYPFVGFRCCSPQQ